MTFREIYGHEKPIAILKGALAMGRIGHAYLFYGMEGIGKRTLARAFAQALNCRAPDPPCGECLSCRKVARQNHPDFFMIRAEGQFIKIATIKALQEQMIFHPLERGRRVFIIEEADRMNASAANALLKTLEEPTAGNILLLTTSRPQSLPMTILSRCQHLRLAPLPLPEVSRYLREQEQLDPATAEVLAASAGGSIGKALEMNREDLLIRRQWILDYLASDDPTQRLRRLIFASRIGEEREEILASLQIIRVCYRDALVFKETGETVALAFRDRYEVAEALAGRLSGRSLLLNLRAIEAAQAAIEQNANKALTLETMVVKLA
ncbi:MAG: DNA polymerase III subunit delta' [Syntrophaceae bacterium]|nr:DNA polymerase III subunit delta' [Syntrophaceae bacterium]